MAFNVLAHNRDDHVKNFAFILDDATGSTGSRQAGDWALTPAYDLLFTPGPGGEHTMTIAGEGRNPAQPHMLKLAEQADVSKREADAIIAEVQTAVANWPEHAANEGVGKATAEQIAQSLPRLP
jgi:serine/threonine-protein kinase HipA